MTYKAAAKFQGQTIRIRLRTKNSSSGSPAEGTFTVLEVSDQSWIRVQRVKLQHGGIGGSSAYPPKQIALRDLFSIEPA